MVPEAGVAETLAGSVGTTQRFLESAAKGVAEKAGLGEEFKTRNDPSKQAVLKMTDDEKVNFIGGNGLESFKNLLR